eukprot:NODE_221_length_13987_cov_0.244888.p9 type:complete len:131 gc:universal NODE_221_length_13987_cov_0.244888:7628-7236(-)
MLPLIWVLILFIIGYFKLYRKLFNTLTSSSSSIKISRFFISNSFSGAMPTRLSNLTRFLNFKRRLYVIIRLRSVSVSKSFLTIFTNSFRLSSNKSQVKKSQESFTNDTSSCKEFKTENLVWSSLISRSKG